MENEINLEVIKAEMEALSDAQKKEFLPHFFKTGKGEYGEGDQFMGVVVPRIRQVAKKYALKVKPRVIHELLLSRWHEMRMCALLMMIERYQRADVAQKEQIFDDYLSHTRTINNWDLVDLSAPKIVGEHLLHQEDRSVLYELVKSTNLWEQRIAIVSTLTFIRAGQYDDTFRLSEMLLNHPHDLIHKAVGWMLREVGKKNETLLRDFLDRYSTRMPRTMLRYAIEKFDETGRLYYLKRQRT